MDILEAKSAEQHQAVRCCCWHVATVAALQRIGRFRRKADKQESRRLPFVTRLTQSGQSMLIVAYKNIGLCLRQAREQEHG